MSEAEIDFIIEIVYRLRAMDLEKYQRTKLVLLSKAMVDSELAIAGFLNEVFDYVESYRPLMIEMKAGV